MRNRRALPLPLRTVVVTTLVAVKRHRDAGNALLVRASVERGLSLLDQLQAALPSDTDPDEMALHERARRELESLMEPVSSDPSSDPRHSGPASWREAVSCQE